MSNSIDPRGDWTVTSTNPGSDDARTVEDRDGNQGEVVNGRDIRDSEGNSIGTWSSD